MPGVRRSVDSRRGSTAVSPACGSLTATRSGPLKPLPNPFVSRSYARRVVWLVGAAGVGVAEVELQDRHRERDHHEHGSDHHRPGVALDPVSPPRPEGAQVRGPRSLAACPPSRARDPVAEGGHQRRQQGHRRSEHEHHREHRGQGHSVEQLDSEREQPHQRDHDGGSGEEHRAAGCVHRQLDRRAEECPLSPRRGRGTISHVPVRVT